jgi:exonuclease-1
VAPYEADGQLAYLSEIGYVDYINTEDSDLLALGCKKVIYKLENDGKCIEIKLDNLGKCRELNFSLFNSDKFLQFCILSGCDYFKIKGIGNKKAYQIIKDINTTKDLFQQLRKAYRDMPDDAEELFEKAFLTFRFQVVYDPLEKKMVYMNEIKDTKYTMIHKYTDLSFLGQ